MLTVLLGSLEAFFATSARKVMDVKRMHQGTSACSARTSVRSATVAIGLYALNAGSADNPRNILLFLRFVFAKSIAGSSFDLADPFPPIESS